MVRGSRFTRWAALLLVCGYARAAVEVARPCVFPEGREAVFRLLDPADGIPFTNIDGVLAKAPSILPVIPEFRLRPGAGREGWSDLVLGEERVAVWEDGRVGFVFGEDGADGGGTGRGYLTSVFGVECDGSLTMHLPPGMELVRHRQAGHLRARNLHPPPSSRMRQWLSTILPTLHRRQTPSHTTHYDPFAFLTSPVWGLVNDRDQKGYAPRCPVVPFGLVAEEKHCARPASFNGCGAENGMKVPDFRFTVCCNMHDLCYDDCGTPFEECNARFRDCMHAACHAYYGADTNTGSPPTSPPPTTN
ncbi:hypothetical protein EJ06DRAFT_549754, partial [Trichodelitschia bisporula]